MDKVSEFDWTREAEEMESLRQEVQTADCMAVAEELRIYREFFARIDADTLEALLEAAG